MPLKIPIEKMFCYESPERKDRLLYWIPSGELKKMMKKSRKDNNSENHIDKIILEDFPDGLEIEVNEKEFAYIKKVYKLDLKTSPDKIKNTVEVLQKSDQISKDISRDKINANELTKLLAKMKEAELKMTVQQAIDERLSMMDDTEKEKLFKVKMSSGDENPLRVFNKLQK